MTRLTHDIAMDHGIAPCVDTKADTNKAQLVLAPSSTFASYLGFNFLFFGCMPVAIVHLNDWWTPSKPEEHIA